MTTAHDFAAAARRIIDLLRERGHVALLAGGCVRDMLLGQEPKDYDVATDATPERVSEIFPRTRQVGAKFGVVLVRMGGHDVEVATFRSDGSYSDGRRPDAVRYGSELDDARRRDFTINGMFLDPVEGRVIDHVGGQEDLRGRIIRTIGDPEQRFAEDHLRLLRAVRFAARLGFSIADGTMEAMRRHAHRLLGISAERIWMELESILIAPSRAAGWRLLLESGLRPHLAPSWHTDAGQDTAGAARLEGLPTTPLPIALPTAALLVGTSGGFVTRLGRELRWSNQLRQDAQFLVAGVERLHGIEAMETADLKLLMAAPCWAELVELLRVDEPLRAGAGRVYAEVAARAAGIAPQDVAPPPLLTGDDLKLMGVLPGRVYGRVLEQVYRAQLNGRIQSREEALAQAEALLRESGKTDG